MKNFDATRSKIKNYLTALKERFSTTEWKDYRANDICKEFGITVTLPQILKSEGYYHYEHKNGVPQMILSEKIMMLSEVTAHNKIREYCNLSKERKAIKQLQKKEKDKLKKKRLDAKAAVKSKKDKYLESKSNFVPAQSPNYVTDGSEGYKNLTVRVGRKFYEEILIDCRHKGLTISQWLVSKLVDPTIESQEPPIEKNIAEIQEGLRNNQHFKDSFKRSIYKSVKPIRQANELIEKLDEKTITGAYYPKTQIGMANQEVLKMVRKYHEPVIEQTDAETKIKSLETIMNLFLKGIINAEELETLKKGILK
jgi:hypothetical protein